MLGPVLDESNVEIGFAHKPFKWANNASKNAAVICVIVSLRPKSSAPKFLYDSERARVAANINYYLADAPNVIVAKTSKHVSGLPLATKGNAPTDNGGLILSEQQKDEFLALGFHAGKFVRRFHGSSDFINGRARWCVWISDSDLDEARNLPGVPERLNAISEFRSNGGTQAKSFASVPHRFVHQPHRDGQSIIIPRHSSERRNYLPIGIISDDSIINDSAIAVYNAQTWLFSVISSRLHLIWTAAVGGRIKSDYRYSNTLVYNTFPLPALSDAQKLDLEQYALDILRIREPYIAAGKTIAWLYNPETMPPDLLKSHRDLDDYLETIYIGRSFKDDAERLEHLFKLYAHMTKKAVKAA